MSSAVYLQNILWTAWEKRLNILIRMMDYVLIKRAILFIYILILMILCSFKQGGTI